MTHKETKSTNDGTKALSQATTSSPITSIQDGAAKELSDLWVEIHFKENSIPSIHAGKLTAKSLAQLQHLIEQREAEARLDEIDLAIKMTRQTWDAKSPFANIENIKGNVLAACAQYLLTRKAALSTEEAGLASDKPTVRKDTEHGRGKS